jgi:glycosyltransferase involved in cell wall biosynthesis
MHRSVLIICKSFYPENTAGAHRVAKTAKYLPEFGWKPVVLCPDWNCANDPWYEDPTLVGKDPCEVVRVPYPVDNRTKIRKAWLVYSSRFFPHLAPFTLRRTMRDNGVRLLSDRRFDVILASCPPTMVLTVADSLAKMSGLPLVVDFRDIPDELGSDLTWTQRLQIKYQTALCRGGRAAVTVSRPLADRLATRLRAPIHVVTNGYDPCDFPGVETVAQDTFDIVYCGGLTPGRDPRLLCAALDQMLAEDARLLDRVRVCFYGPLDKHLTAFTQGYRCAHLIHNMGRVSHEESICKQQQAAALLLLSHREGLGVMTSKVFEYLGAGRPILSVPGDEGVTDELLAQTHAGVIGRTAEEISRILRIWLDEWRCTGTLRYCGRPEVIQQYTRRSQTKRLAEVLDGVVSRRVQIPCEPPAMVK